jgi:hypothetical protein
MVDWSHPLAQGLVGAWLLQEGGGAWTDYAGRYEITMGNPGTSSPQVRLAPSVGAISPSARFVAANYNVLGPTPAKNARVIPTPPFTWVVSGMMTASTSNPSAFIQSSYFEGGSAGGTYALDVYNSRVRAGVYNPSVGYAAATGSTPISSNVRYVFGAVYVSTASRLCFVNGVQDGLNTTAIAQPPSLDAFALGAGYRDENFSRGSSWLDGWIDWAYYYNRALSAQEMLWIYQEPFAMFLPTVPRHAVKAAAAATSRSFAVMVG